MIERADEMAKAVPHLHLSETECRFKFQGALGELAGAQYLNAELVSNSNFNCDLLYRGKKIDVKTLTTNVVPNYTYDGCVPAKNSHQETDYYLFVRLLYRNQEPRTAYLMAYMRREGFYAKASFVRAGSSSQRLSAKYDMYALEYRRMLDPKRMLRDDWPACDSMQLMLTEARNTARALVDPTPSTDRDNAIKTVESWTYANK